MGIPFDSATSYRPGTRFGPSAVREASNILKPYCQVLDADINEHLKIVDGGDIDTIPGYLEESLDCIRNALIPYMKSKVVPILLGGDHLISLGILRALHTAKGPVALVHFDAHSDTVDSYFGKPYNHGSPFYWAIKEGLIDTRHSIQMGIRGPLYDRHILDYAKEQGLRIVMGHELHERGLDDISDEAVAVAGDMPVYVTFDIDFLDASCAPGTGTPEVEGFTTREALYMVRRICSRLNCIGMDLVEVLPDKDPSGITSLAGASVVHAFLATLAKRRANGNR
jgi:agmatinase